MEAQFFDLLPSELWFFVVHYASLNGDLANLRLVNKTVNTFILEQQSHMLRGLISAYSLSPELLAPYIDHHNIEADGLSALLRLSHETTLLSTFCGDRHRNSTISDLLYFSTLTSALKTATTPHQTLRDILSPSLATKTALPLSISNTFNSVLRDDLTLTQLESIISAINIVASKVWTQLLSYVTQSSRVNTFASLSGFTFNIDQAILTEHIIWKGPLWAARLLRSLENRVSETNGSREIEHDIVSYAAWPGSKEDGARIAANGMARLLWKERTRKVDEEHDRKMREEKLAQISITSMVANPVVWRGSSGDM